MSFETRSFVGSHPTLCETHLQTEIITRKYFDLEYFLNLLFAELG